MTTVTTPSPTTPMRAAGAVEARPSGPGPVRVWLRLYRHHLRLLRNGAIAWIVGLSAISVGVVTTYEDRYDSPEELALFAEMEGVPAFEALLGRLVALDTVEGATLSRWGMFAVLAAVWGLLAGARLLRRAEERGHLEFLRAGAVGPRALAASAAAALATTHAAFAVALGASHTAAGMDPGASWALGAAMALLTAAFAFAGMTAGQLVACSKRAVALAGGALGALLGLRVLAAASATPEWVWSTTPFGWVTYLHPRDEAWTLVLSALALLVVALAVPAVALARRDLGAGTRTGGDADLAPRAGSVRGPWHLAARLVAPAVRTWGAIVGLVALTFGLLARDFSEAVAGLETMVALGDQLGWLALDTAEGIIAFTFSIVALLLALFAASQAAAIREEEASWRIELLLVRPYGRVRWLTTRLAASAVALVAVALVAVVAAWSGTAAVGVAIAPTDALAASVNVLPVALLTLGVGTLVLGVAPRLTAALTYGLVLAAYLVDFVGGMLDLPEAALEASPFGQIAAVPAAPLEGGPLTAMLLAGVAAAAVGVAAFRRRDLREA